MEDEKRSVDIKENQLLQLVQRSCKKTAQIFPASKKAIENLIEQMK